MAYKQQTFISYKFRDKESKIRVLAWSDSNEDSTYRPDNFALCLHMVERTRELVESLIRALVPFMRISTLTVSSNPSHWPPNNHHTVGRVSA